MGVNRNLTKLIVTALISSKNLYAAINFSGHLQINLEF